MSGAACFATVLVTSVMATTIDSASSSQFNSWCEQSAPLHERRVFDALSSSEYIDWTQVKLLDTHARLDYTATVENDNSKVVCDVLLEYQYAEKVIALPTTFSISEQNQLVLSDREHIEDVVFEFIVKLMV